jgi:hypothetical protein
MHELLRGSVERSKGVQIKANANAGVDAERVTGLSGFWNDGTTAGKAGREKPARQSAKTANLAIRTGESLSGTLLPLPSARLYIISVIRH